MKAHTVIIILLILTIGLLLKWNFDIIHSQKDVYRLYNDSIAYYNKKTALIDLKIDSLTKINDSLIALPAKIKILYREKYTVIERSNINELDSIIRASF